MALSFYFNDLLTAEAGTALGGIRSEADGLSYHDACTRTFDLNKHMLSNIRIMGTAENGGQASGYARLMMKATQATHQFRTGIDTTYLTVVATPTLAEAQNPTWTGITAAGADVGNLSSSTIDASTTGLVEVALKNITDAGLYTMRVMAHDYSSAKGGLSTIVTYNGGALNSKDSYDVVIINGGVGYAVGDTLSGDNDGSSSPLSDLRGSLEVKTVTSTGVVTSAEYTPDTTAMQALAGSGSSSGGADIEVTYIAGDAGSPGSYMITINNGGTGYSTGSLRHDFPPDSNITSNVNSATPLSVLRGELMIDEVNNEGRIMAAKYLPEFDVNGDVTFDTTQLDPMQSKDRFTAPQPQGSVTYPENINLHDKDSITTEYEANASHVTLMSRPLLGGIDQSKTGRMDDSSFTIFTAVTDEEGIIEEMTHSDESGVDNTDEKAENVVDRYERIAGTLRVGQAEFSALAGANAYEKAQIHMGRRSHENGNLVNSVAGKYTPINLGTTNDDFTNTESAPRSTVTLIDAFAKESNPRDERMWESMLTQLALTSITKYTPNVDFSATNLIDFGVPLKSRNNVGAIVDDYISRGLHESYLGYVTQRFTEGSGASTFAEMIRSVQDVEVPTSDKPNNALETMCEEIASAGRVLMTQAPNVSRVKLQDNDKIHLTVEVNVRDVDDHEIFTGRDEAGALDGDGNLISMDSISPNYLGLAYDNETEPSIDIDTHSQYNSATATGASTPLLRLNFNADNIVRVPKPDAIGQAKLRLRLVCVHKDA